MSRLPKLQMPDMSSPLPVMTPTTAASKQPGSLKRQHAQITPSQNVYMSGSCSYQPIHSNKNYQNYTEENSIEMPSLPPISERPAQNVAAPTSSSSNMIGYLPPYEPAIKYQAYCPTSSSIQDSEIVRYTSVPIQNLQNGHPSSYPVSGAGRSEIPLSVALLPKAPLEMQQSTSSTPPVNHMYSITPTQEPGEICASSPPPEFIRVKRSASIDEATESPTGQHHTTSSRMSGMACKWNLNSSLPCFERTGEVYTKSEALRKHVERHFENEIATSRNITFQCVWSNCNFTLPNQDASEELRNYYSPEANAEFRDTTLLKLWNHLNFHIYHEYIKYEGDMLIKKKGGVAKNGTCSANHGEQTDMVVYHDTRNPDGTEPFPCQWMGCTKNFTFLPDLINHLYKRHVANAEVAKIYEEKPKKDSTEVEQKVYDTVRCHWLREGFSKEGEDEKQPCTYKSRARCLAEAKRLMRRHVNSHVSYKQYACSTCGQTFANPMKFVNHFRRQINKEACDYQCPKCDQVFATESLAKDHMRSVHDKARYLCDFCNHTARVPAELKRHIIYKHSQIRQFPCDQCERIFKTSYDLQTHVFTQHEKLNNDKSSAFGCDLCDFTTRSISNMSDHKRLRHPENPAHLIKEPYKCHLCLATFARGRILTTHYLKEHDVLGFDKRIKYNKDKDGFYMVDPESLKCARYREIGEIDQAVT